MLRICTKSFLNTFTANNFKNSIRNYTPRRAVLYVPGSDLKKILKSFIIDIDCIVLDCEDGVALNKKTQARTNIREMLDKGKPKKKRSYDLAVRVNSVSSGLLKDDLSVILTGQHVPNTILLPKIESTQDLSTFSDYLNEFVKPNKKIGLIMAIESPKSLLKCADFCDKAQEMSATSKFKPVALLFGSDDYCASIGARRSESSIEILYARQKIVSIAKAFNLQAIDMVYINYKDNEGLKKQAEEGAKFGFNGKQVIHPGQIEITQTTFVPTQKEVEWATAVVKAFHKHQTEGQGAFTYKGQMIDMPTMKQAQNIMELVNAVMVQK